MSADTPPFCVCCGKSTAAEAQRKSINSSCSEAAGGFLRRALFARSASPRLTSLGTFLFSDKKVPLRRMQCCVFAAENAYHTVLLHGRPQGSPLRGLKRILRFKLQFMEQKSRRYYSGGIGIYSDFVSLVSVVLFLLRFFLTMRFLRIAFTSRTMAMRIPP